jgi:L-seryl-tRNA(Ser) seleniumtransferase
MTTRRALPSVGTTLERAAVAALAGRWPRDLLADAVRDVIAAARDGGGVPDSDPAWVSALEMRLDARTRSTLRRAINATGVVLHTNLGRAPLARAALDAIARVAGGAATLEYDVARGERGSRHVHCAALLADLTGAEDAIVVNNCAGALILALQAFAAGRASLVSRGELVEIGGSFRIPDVMRAAGATLVEVGTTNRTHLADYAKAADTNTGAIVKVHRSNFSVDGFVAEASVADLVPLAATHGVPLVHDFGSGLMLDLAPFGLAGEPTARDAVRDGATLVLMSGDKLLGGPQAGIILGTRDAIATLRAHPLARALRVDKLTLAALEATLSLYRDPARAVREIPTLAMLTATADDVRARAAAFCDALGDRPGHTPARVTTTEATVGGGAFPTARIPSSAVALGGDVVALEQRLRGGATPVIARIADGRLLLDLRSVQASESDELLTLVQEALQP